MDLGTRGWSNWAVEIRDTGQFIGFIGLTVPRRVLPFSPCVELGYRLCRASWGHGYATEGAIAALRFGFEQAGLAEIVSFTAKLDLPTQAVMRRVGLHDTGRDFEHPAVPEANPLRSHCLYLATRDTWRPPSPRSRMDGRSGRARCLPHRRRVTRRAPVHHMNTPLRISIPHELGRVEVLDRTVTIDLQLSACLARSPVRSRTGCAGRVSCC